MLEIAANVLKGFESDGARAGHELVGRYYRTSR